MARIKFRGLLGKSLFISHISLYTPHLRSLPPFYPHAGARDNQEHRLINSGSVQDFFFTRPEPGNSSPVGGDGSGGGSASGSASGTGIGRNRRVSGERDGGR